MKKSPNQFALIGAAEGMCFASAIFLHGAMRWTMLISSWMLWLYISHELDDKWKTPDYVFMGITMLIGGFCFTRF